MSSGSNNAIPPGPTGHWAFGNRRQFSHNPLSFLQDCARKYGDVVKVADQTYLLAAPATIGTVLGDDGKLYGKADPDPDPGMRRPAFPASVMNSSGAVWQHKRRTLMPAFRAALVRESAMQASAATRSLLHELGDSCATQDMRTLMTGLCAQLGAGFLLGDSENAADLLRMLPMVDAISKQTRRQSLAPTWWPSSGRRRLRRLRADIDMALDRILMQSTQRPPRAASVLALLLAETARDDGDWCRDEAAAILMSALEPMSAALTWTLLLLAQHPHIAQEVAQEASALDGADVASGTSLLDRLPQSRACVKESMRLYPPAWITARIAQRDATLNGFHVPRGTQLLVSAWVVHRDGRHFPDPEIFLPARWLDDSATHSLTRYSYFPFGGGPRSCIGSMLALTQMTIVIATVLHACSLHLAPDARPSPFPALVLRPMDVRIALRPRVIRSVVPSRAHASPVRLASVTPND
ncbi:MULTISPECIES: cytochrome P450 [Xanthomonas]|uniref:cytochrome P450 n=1 Tax=Xanthomonas TaxID=338 RepID=UPI00096FD564|nr:cytochrome P450 [Xanthomonas campestris]MCC5092923.1 cytochrome P450 [Xanthomonas campestris pv. incanae]MEA9610571.1 cytochrome P450 [Xanthomonas campestris pv. incanae]MEA9618035.1 cytochrome P450 [Xanthomonas campestris pv. incanae]RFF46748.1 cytochrome P450 [Xanthomonas campestris pv. incanae]WDJ08996.1 cytochrome P450 [Xanthomonas campestris pv. incanae]